MQLHKRKQSESRENTVPPVYLTPEGIERLHEQLARLKKRLPIAAEEAARTAAFGDRSDNAEYKQAKGALRFTNREIERIEDQSKRAVAIPSGRNKDGTVQLGSVVVLKQLDGDASEKTYEVVGPTETDPGKGRISHLSPLGKALIGHVEGDEVVIETENGERRWRVQKVG